MSYYFSGYNVLQDFPEEQSYFESKGGLGGINTMGLNQSKLTEEQIYLQSFHKEPYDPKDLGIEIYETLKKEHKLQRKCETYDAIVLFDFWKSMSKSRKNAQPPRMPSKAKAKPTGKPNPELEKYQQLQDEKIKHQQNLAFFLQCDGRDVKYTLQRYAKEEEEDQNISKFYREQEMEDSMKASKKKIDKKSQDKRIEKALKRLYPSQVIPIDETPDQKEQRQRDEFMRTLITQYKEDNPDIISFRRPDILYPYWEKNKGRQELSGDPTIVNKNMELYFSNLLEKMMDIFYKKNGYRSESSKTLIKLWRTLSEEEKLKNHLDFEVEQDFKELIDIYLSQKKEAEDIAKFMTIKMQKQKEQEDREKFIKEKQQIQQTRMEEMSKPKDRLKVGKAILELLKMHPEDKVLRKMLLREFQDTRVAKHPLEYDVVDSDEENKIKIRHSTQSGGVIMNIEELELPNKLKQQEIANLFENHLNSFYSTKNQDLRKKELERRELRKQEAQLKQLIERSAEKYLELRKRRYEEKIPTLNDYLSTLYKECLKKYKIITQKNFSHKTYGESKRLKQKSFPLTLKRYFFACMKAFVRKKYQLVKDKENRLAFWVPSCSSGNQPTINKRVIQQTRTAKEEKILQNRPETNAWDKNGFLPERLKVMMTYSDAQECTFQPRVCYRMPYRLKKQMKETHNWAPNIVDRKGTFENFLKQFGDNFKKIPKVFKFGIYKRAALMARKGELVSAYKLVAENFDIHAMKIEFEDPDRNASHPIFNNQRLGLDEETLKKIPRENFKDESNRNFLFEVYQFLKSLEKYEQDLSKTKSNIQKLMSKSDGIHRSLKFEANHTSTYDERKNQIKDQMCPLGQDCPSLKPRWPVSDVSGVVPLGAECMFAHHMYELKFARELKAKRHLLDDVLKQVNQKLSGEVKKKAWNPGGAQFVDCIGCGESLGSKGNKGICLTCQMRKTNLKRLDQFRQKAIQAKSMLVNSKSFKLKDKERTETYKNINKKTGCLAKASALCAKERYTEAFKVIIEAVEIVKEELEGTEKKLMSTTEKIKKQLGLEADAEITAEQVFLSTLPDYLNPDDPLEPMRLHMYAKKTGLVSDGQPDANEFINLQIEKMYKKIESSLMTHQKDIAKIHHKIEKLEDEDDMVAKGHPSKQKTKMCPDLMENGICEKEKGKCKFAHSAIELDLVPNEKKILNLNKTIKQKMQDLQESKTPVSWVQCARRGAEDYQDTKVRDREADIKRLKQSPKRGLSKARSFKDHSIKTIYQQDLDDLKTPVAERRKKY